MATPPDFSVGQVLTAAHMDAVGLWLVKTQTKGVFLLVSSYLSSLTLPFKLFVSPGCLL